VATAHVPNHALGAVVYAQQAVYRAASNKAAANAVASERDWQYQALHGLNETHKALDQ
jgi:hypothetical protein